MTIQPVRPVETTEADRDPYLSELDHVLCETHEASTTRAFADLVCGAAGAFPTLVAERLKIRGLRWSIRSSDVRQLDESKPELHPLDYEWPFSLQTVDYIVDWLGAGRTNLIGLPSVALRAPRGFCLIERNPFALLRAPELLQRGKVVLRDVQDLRVNEVEPAATVAFDPPWYLGETLLWLVRAVELAPSDARIGFVLFPRLLRPTAAAERDLILSFAATLGDVEVYSNVMEYTTPRFETEALITAGVPPLNAWRHGDFVVLRLRRPAGVQLPLFAKPLERESWERFKIGQQVLKLRTNKRPRDRGGDILSPVLGTDQWCYPSVSHRDDHRERIDLWTSRNRVAAVNDFYRAKAFLKELSLERSPARLLNRYRQSTRRAEATIWSALLDMEEVDD